MQVIDAMISEIGAFGFCDFKIPKAFRSQLFDRYPLTVQDSIYNYAENVHFDLPRSRGLVYIDR